jgi:hypothetical protein
MPLHFTLICCFVLSMFVQGVSAQSGWTSVYSNSQIEVSSRPADCEFSFSPMDNYKAEVLRVKNKTASAISVTFRLDIHYNGTCRTCSNTEYKITLALGPNASFTGDCAYDASVDKQKLVVFKEYMNRSNNDTYTKFVISSVSIN